MATLIWARRGRISIVLTFVAVLRAAWGPMHKAPVPAASGGSAYVTPDLGNVSADPNIAETTITAEPATVDLGPAMGGGGLHANMLTFNGSIPGPTFHLKVGQTVIVHFVNHIAHN